MRIWRNDHRAVPIGLPQCFVLRPLEREISQTIVHKVDIVPIEPKSAAVIAKPAGVGDKRFNTPLGQNLPCQHELGIEILLLRTIIDDSDPVGCAGSPLAPPLVLEHPEDCVLEAVPGGVGGGSMTAQHARCARARSALRNAPPAFVLTSINLGPSPPRWKSYPINAPTGP